MKILVIIPARGNSKGIPRKNIRSLVGKPLIYYAITNALKSKHNLDVFVSSDDDEILHISQSLGAKVHKRHIELAQDDTTLDAVIYQAYKDIQENKIDKYNYVITLQPTSPILKSLTLDLAIDKILNDNGIDTIISAKEDAHLSWSRVNNQYMPNYKERLNRQYLNPIYRETGGFVITKTEFINENNRFGLNVDLYLLKDGEEIDIDDYQDWSICEYNLKRKNIVFVVKGNKEFGLGHVYNTLIIANDMTNHNLTFLVDKDSQLAYEKIKSKFFNVYIQDNDNIVKDIVALNPDVVINDKLDNLYQYIDELKQHDIVVINIEDKGDGAKLADMVINAIYSSKEFLPKHYFGPEYYIVRDEFLLTNAKEEIRNNIENILITFGGTDPNNLTLKVVESLYDYCLLNNIEIHVVAGLGYNMYETLSVYSNLHVHRNVTQISKHMLKADVVFSAMGRTLYEIASLGIPSILMAQNERELTHTFGYGQNGFVNLGLFKNIDNKRILKEFKKVQECSVRELMNDLMLQHNLKSGRKRVIKLINNLIEG